MSALTIGVFDSGMGGLTAMEALTEKLPGANLIYFGDTGHMPYGGRSSAQLHYMARRNVTFLEARGAQLILAACGTVTSVALADVAKETATPLFGVASPAVERAAGLTKNKKIGFIATEACVRSGFNQALLENGIPGAEIHAVACPRLVPLIEAGISRGDDPALAAALAEYLTGIRDTGCDTVILGCTHYPIIAKAISDFLGPDTVLVSSSYEAAAALVRALPDRPAPGCGQRTYFTSGDPAAFARTAEKLLGRPLAGEIIAVEPWPVEDTP